MNRRRFLSSTAAATAGLALDLHATQVSNSARTTSNNGLLSELWGASTQHFRSALRPGPGFSFSYKGHWAKPAESVSEQDTGSSIETTWHHADGIEVVRSFKKLPGSDAVEYSVRFRNTGNLRSGPISRIEALDILFGPETLNGTYLLSSGGGTFDGVYPPEAFAIRKHYFGPTAPVDGEVNLTTEGGRSSNKNLPFYFLHNDDHAAGIFVGIGWTGQWRSTISANYDDLFVAKTGLRVRGGIPDIHIQLEPGEEISGPTILLGSYQGSLADGSNKLRRLIRDHYTPKLDGKQFGVIATYDSWWNITEKTSETILRPVVDAAAELGQEYFVLDAAWYAGADGIEGFSGGTGNWEQVDANKFPDGLLPLADCVRSRNLQFGLWFEPERVFRNSLLGKQHPDWVIWLNDSNNYGLLDYGMVEVQEWVKEMLDRHITQLGLRYIRHDFNLDPLAYWDLHDTATRRGISQIRHIEGLYKVIDWIRERHPSTVLECCASGGRRIDLETARRFHSYWISDDTADPMINRFHLQGINYFLPGNYSYVQYTLPAPAQKNYVPSDFDYLSCFGGAFGAGGRLDLWPAAQKERFKVIEKLHKKIRGFLMQDYYALLPQSLDLNGWDAWQFHDPSSNSGFIQVFRQASSISSLKVAAFGLKPDNLYEFKDPLAGTTIHLSGAVAMKDGILFEQKQMSSIILMYQAKA